MYTDTDFLQVHSITLYRELKSKITDMKNSLEGLSNRSEQAEERIHEPEIDQLDDPVRGTERKE